MDITLTLSPVEVDALLLAFPNTETTAALHILLQPVVFKTAEMRLQRLATEYRTLTPADQLEATKMLAEWRAKLEAERGVPLVDAAVETQ
jgi:hypothetical protein